MIATTDNDDSDDRNLINRALYRFLSNQIEFQKSLQRAFQPTHEFEQAIKQTARTFSSFQAASAGTLAQQQVNLQMALQRALQPTLEFEQAIKQTVERFRSLQTSWASALAQQQDNLQTTFQRAFQPALQFQQAIKQLESIWASALAQQDTSLQANFPRTVSAEDLQRFLGQIEEVAREVSEAQLNITPEGQIESRSGNLPLTEAAEGIERFSDMEALTKSQDELSKKLEAVLCELHDQNSPLRLIILTILLPLLINLLSDLMNPALHNITGSNDEPSQAKDKAVQISNMNPPVNPPERIVSADVLNVRESPDGKSRLLGKLYFGQTVRVLQKDRGWELVESELSSIAIRGWVSSSYLDKIKN